LVWPRYLEHVAAVAAVTTGYGSGRLHLLVVAFFDDDDGERAGVGTWLA
jgi:hypothetical protein